MRERRLDFEETLSPTAGQSQAAKGKENTLPAPRVHPKMLSDRANRGSSSPKRSGSPIFQM